MFGIGLGGFVDGIVLHHVRETSVDRSAGTSRSSRAGRCSLRWGGC